MRTRTFSIVAMSMIVLLTASMVSAYAVSVSEDNSEFYDKVDQAIADNDYDAWKEVMMSSLTEENFNKQVEFRQNMEKEKELREELMQAWKDGDSEKVEELQKELEDLVGNTLTVGVVQGPGKMATYGFAMAAAPAKNAFFIGGPAFANLSKEDKQKLQDLRKELEQALEDEDTDKAEEIQSQISDIMGVEAGTTDIFITKTNTMMAGGEDVPYGMGQRMMVKVGKGFGRSFWDAFRFW